MLSAPQFQSGQPLQYSPNIEAPLALSQATAGSAGQATAWRNRSLGGGRPMAFSAKTRGTTFNWDGGSSTPNLPQSDKGAGRNE